MENSEQDNKEDRYTPDTRSKRFIRFIGFGSSEFRAVFTFKYGRKVFRYVFIPAVCDYSLKIGSESIVGKSLFELFDHRKSFFMHLYFKFVLFYEFNGME